MRGREFNYYFLKADLASEKCSYAKIRAELRSVLTVVTRQ